MPKNERLGGQEFITVIGMLTALEENLTTLDALRKQAFSPDDHPDKSDQEAAIKAVGVIADLLSGYN